MIKYLFDQQKSPLRGFFDFGCDPVGLAE